MPGTLVAFYIPKTGDCTIASIGFKKKSKKRCAFLTLLPLEDPFPSEKGGEGDWPESPSPFFFR